MSTLLQEIVAGASPPPLLTDVETYHAQIDAGLFPPDRKIELLDGLVVLRDARDAGGDLTEMGPQHVMFSRRFRKRIEPLAEVAGAIYRNEAPVTLPPSHEPQPDGVVARGTDDDYADRHPGPDEILLVVEVAWSSLPHDRGTKRRVYAAAGLAPCWILNVADRTLEVFTNPDPVAGVYRDRAVLTAVDTATIPLPTGDAPLPLADLLG